MQKRGFVFLPGQELALAGAKNKTPAMAQPCGALLLGCFADCIRITERREVILGFCRPYQDHGAQRRNPDAKAGQIEQYVQD